MCNAWNHSNDCACGWGGLGHKGGRGDNSSFINIIKPKFKSYSELLASCTIPNAKCPVCGMSVFFYTSPHNGRVFFDELGPPWPKHPCTSNDNRAAKTKIPLKINIISPNLNHFDDKEWKPFLCLMVEEIPNHHNIYAISGYLNDQKRMLFTNMKGLSDDLPFFIKESNSETRLSTFVSDGKSQNILEFVVKKYQSEIANLIPQTPLTSLLTETKPTQNKPGKTRVKTSQKYKLKHPKINKFPSSKKIKSK
jgi:hypothetical protein